MALHVYGFNGIKGPEQVLTTPDAGKKDLGKIIVCEKEDQGEVVFTLDGGSAFVPEAVISKKKIRQP